MKEVKSTLLQLSIGLLTVATRGNPNDFVHQQIEAMGLLQWLCFVTIWIVTTISHGSARFRDFITTRLCVEKTPAKRFGPTAAFLFYATMPARRQKSRRAPVHCR